MRATSTDDVVAVVRVCAGNALDPTGIFNPGKVFGDPPDS
ncbi:FAD-binding oxidoreductase [Saccharopolyspora sp. ASAGF58]|nr:FAD-binding oxidoreductase [Saccharopolyspora sp. ASAGF58]